jgi:class 3 adenylate cyclase
MVRILLVDDTTPARRVTARLLRDRGHGVREADGLRSAIAALEAEAFDLILTDLRMPDGNGLDVLRASRARRPEALVILLTAYAEWQSAKDAMRLGAIDYLEKGTAPDDFVRRVEDAVALSRGDWMGTDNPALASALGSPDAVRGQRMVLTVLLADLRESLQLIAGQDLEGARALLDAVVGRLIDAVHHHGGTVNQVMGDGIMALFGAPRRADDHALRACTASWAMQDAVVQYSAALRRARGQDVQIRVGLASGEVIVRSLDHDLRRDYTAVGLTTHLAARLEQAARPGTVLMSAATRHQAGRSVRVIPRGRMVLKGLPDGVDTYELLGLVPSGEADAVAPACEPDSGPSV